MGRPRLTPEKRAAKLDEATRVQLLMLLDNRDTARAQAAKAETELREAVVAAVAGQASFRDVAAVLGMPHQSVHQLVKPYVRRSV